VVKNIVAATQFLFRSFPSFHFIIDHSLQARKNKKKQWYVPLTWCVVSYCEQWLFWIDIPYKQGNTLPTIQKQNKNKKKKTSKEHNFYKKKWNEGNLNWNKWKRTTSNPTSLPYVACYWTLFLINSIYGDSVENSKLNKLDSLSCHWCVILLM
jgi:hypothetical protein